MEKKRHRRNFFFFFFNFSPEWQHQSVVHWSVSLNYSYTDTHINSNTCPLWEKREVIGALAGRCGLFVLGLVLQAGV